MTGRLTALAACAALAACVARDALPPLAAPDAGESALEDGGAEPVPVRDGGPASRRDGGVRREDGGADGGPVTLPPEVIEVEVQTFEPRRGPSTGGTEILITGRGFIPGTAVSVGGASIVDPYIQNERRITGRTPPGAAGVAPVIVVNRAARLEVPGGFTYEAPVEISAVAPDHGPAGGGTVLRVEGAGFTPGSVLLLGGRPAFATQVLSAQRIAAVTPPGAPGPADVSVVGRTGAALGEGAFRYLAEPELTAADPNAGPLAGGNTIRLLGAGFDASMDVFFGGVRAVPVTAVSAVEALVEVPAARTPGAVDLAVRTEGGTAVLRGAYAYFLEGGSLSVQAVTPARGPTSGGTEVVVVGSALDAATEVTFAGTPATALDVVGPGVLRAVTPAGTAGAADVAVRAGGMTAMLPAGFLYEPELRVLSAAPARGPSAGGTEVEIRGAGFGEGAEVFFGPLAAASVHRVDTTALLARTTPGGAGTVDVVVRVGERRATLPAGFTYVDAPKVFRVEPPRGAIAGGTFVIVTGTGFGPGTLPYFNGAPAVDVSVRDASTLTARTPKGEEGPAEVAVASPAGSASLPDAFTYFDPSWRYGGTSGGPVAGAVNATVVDGYTRRRIDGAFVTLATTTASAFQGFTDANGQVVLSGPDLAGRQTVTAAKEGYTISSVASFDAENVTLFLDPLSFSFGPGTPPPEPPTIRGTLKNAFKPIPPPPPGYSKSILVTTTAPDRYRAGYSAPGFIQVLADDGREDRAYEIRTRFGDVAVYALGGHLKDDATRFVPLVMGIHRYVTVIVGPELIEGIDVTLDADLNATFDARLLTAPPLSPEGPSVYRMRVYLELGIDGVVTFFQQPESTSEPRLVQEHLPVITGSIRGASFTALAGAYQIVNGYETLPLSEIVKEGLTDLSAPVELGPFMGIPRAARPLPGDVQVDRRFAWQVEGPPVPSVYILYLPQPLEFGPAATWEVVVPGFSPEFNAPDLAALAGLPALPASTAVEWYVIAADARRFDIDAFDYRDFFRSNWRSYAMTRHGFMTAD